jgi:hypothetical protein
VRVVDRVPTFGEALFGVVTEDDCEGTVGKRFDSPYRAARQPACRKDQVRRVLAARSIAVFGLMFHPVG